MSTFMPPLPVAKDPAGWTPGEILQSEDWLHRLSEEESDELISVAAADGSEIGDGSMEPSRLRLLEPQIERIASDLGSGPGLRVIRGVPVERLGEQGAAKAFMAIGRGIGEPMEQPGGVTLAHVRSGSRRQESCRSMAIWRMSSDFSA